MLRPVEKSTIKTRTLSSARRLKTHVRVSLSRVHVNKKKPEAEAHDRLHTLLHVVACYCVLLGVAAQSFNPVKLLSQQLPKFL